MGGLRIGILGLLTQETRSYVGARGTVQIDDPIATARRALPDLRKQADVVVALTHLGIEKDRELARQAPGIDVIVGGHSHTLLARPEFVSRNSSTGSGGVGGTIIVQDFQWGGTLGRLDLTLAPAGTGGWVVSRYSGELLPLTSRIPEDPTTAAVVSKYWKPISARYGEVIGRAAGDFAQKGYDAAEYNLMADAIRAEMGVEFDLENVGGVRAPLVKGPITQAMLAEVDPFQNTVVTFRLSGAELKRILLADRPAVSGIEYEVAGGRLVRAEIGGAPIDDNRLYTGAANSFMAERSLKGARDLKDTGRGRRETLVAYIRKQGTVQPAYDGRRIIRGE
jgi:2',3'-cyclic-nucleotide 2'-phosphodiesterase (5'-nucleotidase family)